VSAPIDNETYGSKRTDVAEVVRNGNPGKPQSDYLSEDPVPQDRGGDFPNHTSPRGGLGVGRHSRGRFAALRHRT